MKNWLKILIALVIIGIVAAALVYKFYINKPHADIEKATPVYAISAAELWEQYNTDLGVSDSLYTGQVIEITGNLSRTDQADTLVFAVFVMEADSMFGDKSIRCEMLSKFNEEARSIGAGTEVRFKGYCNGFDQTDIKFSKCSIIK